MGKLIMREEIDNMKQDSKDVTVKLDLSGHSKRRPKNIFKTDYRLIQGRNIAECSKRAFCNISDLQ